MDKPNGIILFQTDRIVAIATGIRRGSRNPKTGSMIHTWVLRKDRDPIAATRDGSDRLICGDCSHRGSSAKEYKDRSCYVQTFRAPLAIWKAYRAGRYRRVKIGELSAICEGRSIRIGSYGDPVKVPFNIWKEMISKAQNFTGYSHQWRNPFFAGYRSILMASVDSIAERDEAIALGWRTFRVSRSNDPQKGEILCPASKEAGYKTTCKACGLCKGNSISAKTIVIPSHGATKRHFNERAIA